MSENVKLLRDEFDKEFIHYSLCDKEDKQWYLYSVYDRVQDIEWYEVFKYRTTINPIAGRYQIRPIPKFMKDDSWYCICDTEDECYTWLRDKKLIEGIIVK